MPFFGAWSSLVFNVAQFCFPMKILQSRPHVVRKSDTETIGILALAMKEQKIYFVWVSSSDLHQAEILQFRDLGNLELRENVTHYEAELDSIAVLRIDPQLSLYEDKACCLTSLVLCTERESWPELWFNPINMQVDSPVDILYLIRSWIRSFKRDLVSLEDGTHDYYLTEQLQPMTEFINPQWREKEGLANKLGSFGLGVVSTLFGTPVANV
jgi:hypothetical protein